MSIFSDTEIETTYPNVDTVQLDSNALVHIQTRHPEVLEQGVGDIVSTVSNPDQIYEGNQPTTNIFGNCSGSLRAGGAFIVILLDNRRGMFHRLADQDG